MSSLPFFLNIYLLYASMIAPYWLLISAFTVSDPIWPFHQFDSTILISTPQFIPPPPIYCRNSVILPNWPPEFKGVLSKNFFEEQSDYGKGVTVTF